MRLVLIVMLALMPLGAFAQEEDVTAENSALCRILERQGTVKGAAYEPGVDVRGKPVVPADVGGVSAFGLPDVITIPLDVSLQNRLRSLEEFGFDADTNLGVAEIYPDGKVSINGQDVSSQTGILCAKSQRIVTGVREEAPQKAEVEVEVELEVETLTAAPAAEVIGAQVIEKEPLDSMTSIAAERGILDKVMAEPEPKPQMTKEEIAEELKSIVTDLNDLENNEGLTENDLIKGGDFRE